MYIGRKDYIEPLIAIPNVYLYDKLLPKDIYDIEVDRVTRDNGVWHPTLVECWIKSEKKNIDLHFICEHYRDKDRNVHLDPYEKDVLVICNGI